MRPSLICCVILLLCSAAETFADGFEKTEYKADSSRTLQYALLKPQKVEANVAMTDLIDAMRRTMMAVERRRTLHVTREVLSVRDRMVQILDQVKSGQFARIEEFFSAEEGRRGLVVSFVAILELVRDGLLRLTQNEDLAPIYVQLPDS